MPGSFDIGSGVYYELSTTASFTGNITVCITYDPLLVPVPESDLQLLHWTVATGWTNITSPGYPDLINHVICGVTSSLSPFVIGVDNTTGVGDGLTPARTALHQNSPNPFSPTTAIAFDVRTSGEQVRIRVNDMAGRPHD